MNVEYLQSKGFSLPLFVREKTGLQMTMPEPDFNVSDVSQANISSP